MDPIRAAIQKLLDDAGDGWSVSGFVVVMRLERLGPDGMESIPWMWEPLDQPDWIGDGLLIAAERMRDTAETE